MSGSDSMKVAIGQFAAAPEWSTNAQTCRELMTLAEAGGAGLLVLPEGIHARWAGRPTKEQYEASDQPIGGPFIDALLAHSVSLDVTTVVGTKGVKEGVRRNTLVVIRDGKVIAEYDKLHVMDAYAMRESDLIGASDNPPVLFECGGFTVGLMICYDVRFPEISRLLTLAGADILALPAAWVAGHGKERHWQVLTAARALENTVYLAGSGECGPSNVGQSVFIDPMGVVRSELSHDPGLIWGEVRHDELEAARTRIPVLQNRRFAVDATVLPVPRDYASDPMPDIDALIARGMVLAEP